MIFCLLTNEENVVYLPDWVSMIVVFFVIALVVLCVILQKKKQKREEEEAAKAEELKRLQFNQDLEQYREKFKLNGLPAVTVEQLQLVNGEVCHFYSEAIHCKIKNRVVGYEGGYRGRSVRIFKGFSIRTGSTARQAIRENVEITTEGHLYVTNKKIVFVAPSNSKSISMNSIISLNIYNDYVVILSSKEENMFSVPNQALLFSILRVLLHN